MRKFALRLTVALLLVAGVLFVGRAAIGRWMGQLCLRRLTGIDARVEPVSLGWTRGQFEVRDVTCSNLHRGGNIITAHLPRLVVDYEPCSLLRRQLHVYAALCEIKNLEIISTNRPADRRTSTNHTRLVSSSVRVDTLQLKLNGSLAFSSVSSATDVQRIQCKMEATLHDVRDFDALRAALLPQKNN